MSLKIHSINHEDTAGLSEFCKDYDSSVSAGIIKPKIRMRLNNRGFGKNESLFYVSDEHDLIKGFVIYALLDGSKYLGRQLLTHSLLESTIAGSYSFPRDLIIFEKYLESFQPGVGSILLEHLMDQEVAGIVNWTLTQSSTDWHKKKGFSDTKMTYSPGHNAKMFDGKYPVYFWSKSETRFNSTFSHSRKQTSCV
jgi:hypothetical protein